MKKKEFVLAVIANVKDQVDSKENGWKKMGWAKN